VQKDAFGDAPLSMSLRQSGMWRGEAHREGMRGLGGMESPHSSKSDLRVNFGDESERPSHDVHCGGLKEGSRGEEGEEEV
jgi:hypothetical protein